MIFLYTFWLSMFCLGYLVIYYFADIFIDNLKEISLLYKISPIIIGLFILGVDIEESIVSVVSAFNNLPYISIGNLIGNTIIAISISFGFPAIFLTIKTKKLPKYFMVILILLGFSVLIGITNTSLFYFSAIFNLFIYCIYVVLSIKHQKAFRIELENDDDFEEENEMDEAHDHTKIIILKLFFCFIFIFLAAELMIKSTEVLIDLTGLSESFFGLVIIAYVTNVEELFLIIKAVQKNQTEMGVSAEIGKIIWNISLIYGICGLIIKKFTFSAALFYSTLIFVFLIALLIFNLLKRNFNRYWGIFYIIILIFFIWLNFYLL